MGVSSFIGLNEVFGMSEEGKRFPGVFQWGKPSHQTWNCWQNAEP